MVGIKLKIFLGFVILILALAVFYGVAKQKNTVSPHSAELVTLETNSTAISSLQEIPPQGMPSQGIPPQGMPPQGISPQGIPTQGMSTQGIPPQGIPTQGMPTQGMPPQGMPLQGMPPQGMPPQGMLPQGMIPQGMPPQGMGGEYSIYSKMMMDMQYKMLNFRPVGDVDIDFVAVMIPHHQGAIDIAKFVLEKGKDPEIKKLAEGIIKAQESEIKLMNEWFATHKK